MAAAVLVLSAAVWAQTVEFDLLTFPDSPVVFADTTQSAVPGIPRRQLVTIKDASKKSVSAVIFEQTVAKGSKTEIVAIERVSIVMAAGEKRRVTVAVADMSAKLESGAMLGRPVLSIVAVEYLDGTQWNAPMGSR